MQPAAVFGRLERAEAPKKLPHEMGGRTRDSHSHRTAEGRHRKEYELMVVTCTVLYTPEAYIHDPHLTTRVSSQRSFDPESSYQAIQSLLRKLRYAANTTEVLYRNAMQRSAQCGMIQHQEKKMIASIQARAKENDK